MLTRAVESAIGWPLYGGSIKFDTRIRFENTRAGNCKFAWSDTENMDAPKPLNEIVLPQGVVGPLTRSAIFLVVTVRPDAKSYAAVREFCADLSGLVRAVEFRDARRG